MTFAASVQRVADLVGGIENVTVEQIKAIYSDLETIETVKLADAINEIAEEHGGLEKLTIGQLINGMGIQTGVSGGWVLCVLGAIIAGALLGALSGLLKAFRNVNEVISGIMLNWITLYLINMLLASCMDQKMNETWSLKKFFPNALLPTAGVDGLFHGQSEQTTIAIPIAILVAVLIWYLLTKTKKGYELRATGLNKDAAKYAGMKGRTNIITTMAIAGALAGLGAALFYLTDNTKWSAGQATVPSMGFNGIAAAFLGGLHPIGAIFSSFFIQHITDGGSFMEKIYPAEIASLISSVIIYMCAFVLFIRQTMNKSFSDKDARKHAKLVSETKGILHGELQEDFDQSVASAVSAEIEKSAANWAKKAPVAPEPKRISEPEAESDVEADLLRQAKALELEWGEEDEEESGKDKKKKKKDKNRKEKKGGSDE
ncbi:MAG: ABC transporter permease [Clostridia bacterium]|nr:ABC transporter permease [Clostridia bacterium]